jgi:hypothetical protein
MGQLVERAGLYSDFLLSNGFICYYFQVLHKKFSVKATASIPKFQFKNLFCMVTKIGKSFTTECQGVVNETKKATFLMALFSYFLLEYYLT